MIIELKIVRYSYNKMGIEYILLIFDEKLTQRSLG